METLVDKSQRQKSEMIKRNQILQSEADQKYIKTAEFCVLTRFRILGEVS